LGSREEISAYLVKCSYSWQFIMCLCADYVTDSWLEQTMKRVFQMRCVNLWKKIR